MLCVPLRSRRPSAGGRAQRTKTFGRLVENYLFICFTFIRHLRTKRDGRNQSIPRRKRERTRAHCCYYDTAPYVPTRRTRAATFVPTHSWHRVVRVRQNLHCRTSYGTNNIVITHYAVRVRRVTVESAAARRGRPLHEPKPEINPRTFPSPPLPPSLSYFFVRTRRPLFGLNFIARAHTHAHTHGVII